MLLTELAVQNLAGFAPAARFSLKGGMNVLVSAEANPLEVLRAVLFPDPDDARRLGADGTPRKAALTLVGRDGNTYRLVRDFGGGRLLLRSDPATRQAVKVAEDPAEIVQALSALVGVQRKELFLGHLVLAEADLPGRQAPAAVTEAVSLTGVPEKITLTPEEARRKLPQLRQELERAELFERAQDELYGLQQRHAELSRTAGSFAALERDIAEVTARLKAFERVHEVTQGIEARIRKFSESVARREAALAEVQVKRRDAENKLEAIPGLRVMFSDRLVHGGLATGALASALALALGWKELWLLNLLAFGAAAFGAWRWVEQVEDADRSRQRLTDLDELEKRVQKQFEAETQPVYAAMNALGVTTPEEVLHRLEERDMLEARRLAFVRELEIKRHDPEALARDEERRQVEAEVRQREARVTAMGFSRDLATVRRDIALCEELVPSERAEARDVLLVAFERAARVAGTDPARLHESMKERLRQYLAALTDKRFVGVKPAGAAVHPVAASGASGPLTGLAPADRDAIYVAVRLALAERVAATAKLPLLVDDPALLVDPAHRALFVKMLKSLGALTQVLVRSPQEPPAGVADHVAHPVSAATPRPHAA